LIEIEARYGVLKVADIEADIIGRFLARYGEWAWDETCFVASTLPEDGGRVLDIGAFLGTFGLGLALRRRLGFLCFIEANSAIAPLLADNVRRNCLIPAAVVEALVVGHDTQPKAGWSEPGNLGSMFFTASPGPDVLPGFVPSAPPQRAATLAEIRAEHGDFDLVKLDVEGMEHDIMRADAEYLAQGDTTIWVECSEDPCSLAVAELLFSWDFDLYYFAWPAQNPDNQRGDPVPIFPLAYEAGLLAAPRVPPTLDNTLRAHRCILRQVHSIDELKDAMWRTPRWGMLEWVGAGPEEVAALAGRALRGETFDNYLAPSWSSAGAPVEVLGRRITAAEKSIEIERERADTAEAALARTNALLLDRLSELGAERERADTAEAALARTAALSLDRLSELGAERERADTAEAALARTNALLLDRLSELGAERERATKAAAKTADLEQRHAELAICLSEIKASISWRLTAPLRRILGTRFKKL
jgi:FkbM family methyltransferase